MSVDFTVRDAWTGENAAPGRTFHVGGAAGNRVHHEWTTAPVQGGRGDQRATDPEGYQAALKLAMGEDREGDGGDPCLWAVVIETGGTVPDLEEAWSA